MSTILKKHNNMVVHANIMTKNEELLLNELLPIWVNYPVDKFIFYNDNSIDGTVNTIKSHLGDRAVIINDNLDEFNESHNRSRMLEYSRENGATHVIAMDCDELLSDNLVTNFNEVISMYDTKDVYLYWYNVVNNTLTETRNDPSYIQNHRSFILPLKHTGKMNLGLWKYHTPRTPQITLPKTMTKKYGVIHLQSINTKFYALKQLWYKHYEYVKYKHPVNFINQRYDPVVNNLDFMPIKTPKEILGNIQFDHKVYDEMCEHKGYLKFIKENYNKELVTFGSEFID
jgi:hypothetical protein